MIEPQAPAVQQPTQGGSYTLDPITGQLTRVAYTQTQAEAAEATAQAEQAAAPQPE